MRGGFGLIVATAVLGASGAPAAAQDMPAQAVSAPERWIVDDDYPSDALKERAFGITVFRLDVDEAGAVSGCHIMATSGFAALDDQTCATMRRRARFRPARRAGKPIASTYNSRVTWVPPGAEVKQYVKLLKLTSPFDFTIKVSRLPARYGMGPLLRMQYDRSGKVVACRVELESGSAQADKVACQQASTQPFVEPGKIGIRPWPDTRMVAVQFVEGK